MLRVMIAIVLGIGVAVTGGCSHSDGQADAYRQRFLLKDEPAEAVGITEARDAGADTRDVVVIGQISAGEFEPWAEGQASFLLAEYVPENDHAATPGHDPANCPFCRRRAAKSNAATALVQFHAADGSVVPIDARELLGVEKNQVVVVRGKAHVDKLGVLVVDAHGVYLRR